MYINKFPFISGKLLIFLNASKASLPRLNGRAHHILLCSPSPLVCWSPTMVLPPCPGSGFPSLYLVSTCVWHRRGGLRLVCRRVWVFDNIFIGYPDRDPWSLSSHTRPTCSQGDSGLGCCMASLEGSDTCNQSILSGSQWGMLKEVISFLEGCCRPRRKCWARGRGCLGALGIPRMCLFPTVP